MEYLPNTLKLLHLGVAGLGLYVSVESRKLAPLNTPEPYTAATNAGITTAQGLYSGTVKHSFQSYAYIVTIIALAQLAVLFYYHNYGGKETHFRVSYFILAILNIIFGTYLLQGSMSLISVPDGASPPSAAGASAGELIPVEGDQKKVAFGAAALGASVIGFNYINLFHASTGKGGSGGIRISPKRVK